MERKEVRGIITGILHSKGYGFIKEDCEEDKYIFFTAAGVWEPISFMDLREGMNVSFVKVDYMKDKKVALKAVRVKAIEV